MSDRPRCRVCGHRLPVRRLPSFARVVVASLAPPEGGRGRLLLVPLPPSETIRARASLPYVRRERDADVLGLRQT